MSKLIERFQLNASELQKSDQTDSKHVYQYFNFLNINKTDNVYINQRKLNHIN